MDITESPCVQICQVDPVARVCVGCGRTLDEIRLWVSMTAAERRFIMDGLPARLAALDLPVPQPRERTGRRRQRSRP